MASLVLSWEQLTSVVIIVNMPTAAYFDVIWLLYLSIEVGASVIPFFLLHYQPVRRLTEILTCHKWSFRATFSSEKCTECSKQWWRRLLSCVKLAVGGQRWAGCQKEAAGVASTEIHVKAEVACRQEQRREASLSKGREAKGNNNTTNKQKAQETMDPNKVMTERIESLFKNEAGKKEILSFL